jgi:hypothetical protein
MISKVERRKKDFLKTKEEVRNLCTGDFRGTSESTVSFSQYTVVLQQAAVNSLKNIVMNITSRHAKSLMTDLSAHRN